MKVTVFCNQACLCLKEYIFQGKFQQRSKFNGIESCSEEGILLGGSPFCAFRSQLITLSSHQNAHEAFSFAKLSDFLSDKKLYSLQQYEIKCLFFFFFLG